MRIDFAAVPHAMIFPSGAPAYLRTPTSHRTDRQKIGIYIEKNFDICYSINISEVQKPNGKFHPCPMLYQTNKFNRVPFPRGIYYSRERLQIIHGDDPVYHKYYLCSAHGDIAYLTLSQQWVSSSPFMSTVVFSMF